MLGVRWHFATLSSKNKNEGVGKKDLDRRSSVKAIAVSAVKIALGSSVRAETVEVSIRACRS
jgi:hypothetical protein